ncbi:hypothetical protein TMRH483_00782 [Qipengyuania sp. 483]
MRYSKWKLLGWMAVAVATTSSGSAQACRISVSPAFEDIGYADVVVIGRIANYRIVRDEVFRKRMLAAPGLAPETRRIYEDPTQRLLSDYARFDIQVDEVLMGPVQGNLSVTWDNSTFGEPDQIAPGRYLIALRRASSAAPPLRGPSATVLPDPDPRALTLLQAPCSAAFIYEAESEDARTIQSILNAQRR